MDIFHIFILSLTEGLTEFIPVSSTAHLILLSDVLRIKQGEFLTTFNISIQLAAILAVSTLYFSKLKQHPRLALTLFISFLPSGIIGFIFYSFITNTLFKSPLIIISAMGIGGIVLIFVEKYLTKSPAKKIKSLKEISYKKALGIGFVQTFALVPGTSRSASSIVGGLIFGLNRKTAVEFSFLLALPTIAVATGYDLIKNHEFLTSPNLTMLLLGSIIAFVAAYVTMKYFLKFLDKNTLVYFGIYRIIFALISCLLIFF